VAGYSSRIFIPHNNKKETDMKITSLLRAASLCVLGALSAITQVQAASFDKTLDSGKVRVHYCTSTPASCDVIMLGVGTAMSADSYDKLSGELATYGYVTVILDHAPAI